MSTLISRRPASPPSIALEGIEVDHSLGMREYVVPEFTMKDLLDAIPAHCFKRSAFRSSLYVLQDISLITAFTLAINWADAYITVVSFPAPYLQGLARFAAWNAYWLVTGFVGTGIWILAHECGHQAFSESKTLNNAMGLVLHSALGVPYHSWRISHSKHHASTGHFTRDEVFVPRTRTEYGLPAFDEQKEDKDGRWVTAEVKKELMDALEESPIVQFSRIVIQQTLGWPLYLLWNISGQRSYPPGTNHFNPKSPVFEPQHYAQIVLSDIGIISWLATLATWAYFKGFGQVALYYIPVYLWVNHWLILITFLQHTDPLLPHYRNGVWTFPRGALCTIDRTLLGPVGGWLMHGISETHVAHHVSSRIPHYHAWEATETLKRRLGSAYIKSDENVLVSLWKVWRDCKFVEDFGDVVFYKNQEGKARSFAVFQKDEALSDSGVEIIQ